MLGGITPRINARPPISELYRVWQKHHAKYNPHADWFQPVDTYPGLNLLFGFTLEDCFILCSDKDYNIRWMNNFRNDHEDIHGDVEAYFHDLTYLKMFL